MVPNIVYFRLIPGGNDAIWLGGIFFTWVGEKPPTRNVFPLILSLWFFGLGHLRPTRFCKSESLTLDSQDWTTGQYQSILDALKSTIGCMKFQTHSEILPESWFNERWLLHSCIYIKGNYYWRHTCFTSMIMGGRVGMIGWLDSEILSNGPNEWKVHMKNAFPSEQSW